MPDRDYTVTFRVDTTQALTGIAALKAAMQGLDSSFGGTGATANGTVDAIRRLQDTVHGVGNAVEQAGKQAKESSGGMLTMSAAMGDVNMAMMAGVQALGDFGGVANSVRDHIKELAIDTMNLRDKMRELANLGGKSGPDNEVVGETVKMGMKAGMMPDDMRKYLEQYEGSSPAGVQKGHIDQKTKEELALEGAKFANRVKISPATGGDLAGVIPQYTDLTKDKDGKATRQQDRVKIAMGQMGRVAYGLNEGRGNLEPLVRSLLNTAGAVVGGPVEDLAELAAIQGVASTHANPREAGTRVRQAVRALRDTSGPAGLAMKNTMKIGDQDTHLQRLEKVKTYLDKAEKNGKGGDIALREMGFSDDDEIRAIVEEVHDLDIIKQRIEKGRANVTGENVMKANDEFQQKDRAGIRRKQMATKAGQEFLIGEGNERFEMAKEAAEQQLRSEGKIGGEYNDRMEKIDDLFGLRTWAGGERSREMVKAGRAEENLINEAKKKGIPEAEIYAKLSGGKASTREDYTFGGSFLGFDTNSVKDARSERERVKGFNDLATEVERKQGDWAGKTPNLEPKFDALIAETRETNRLLAIQAQKNAGAGPGPPPRPMPPKAAAAPKRP
jgi:hypothetical protein